MTKTTYPQQKRTKRATTTGILLAGAFILALGIAAATTTVGPDVADAFDGDGWTVSAEEGDESMQCIDFYSDPPYVGVSLDHCFPPPS